MPTKEEKLAFIKTKMLEGQGNEKQRSPSHSEKLEFIKSRMKEPKKTKDEESFWSDLGQSLLEGAVLDSDGKVHENWRVLCQVDLLCLFESH